MVGFALHVALVSYLLSNGPKATPGEVIPYAFAMAARFLATDHALRHEHGERYDRSGRWWLAAMALSGWAGGLLVALPAPVLALLLAFVSGAGLWYTPRHAPFRFRLSAAPRTHRPVAACHAHRKPVAVRRSG